MDETELAFTGAYRTPVLAAGKSVTLTATVKFAATPQGCAGPSDVYQVTAGSGVTGHNVYLVTNPLAS